MLPVSTDVEKSIGNKWIKLPETIGRLISPGDVLEEVLKSRVFFEESGGGVTFTGGEPLMQPSFLIECIRLMKENNIHTTLDTAGYASPEDFVAVVRETDLVLFDLKHPDADRYLEFTGGSLETVLRNLHSDALSEKPIIVRIPLVPGFNMDLTVYNQMAVILFKLKNLQRIDLLPYHNFSSHKYLRLGLDFKMEGVRAPGKEDVSAAADFFRNCGFKVSVGG